MKDHCRVHTGKLSFGRCLNAFCSCDALQKLVCYRRAAIPLRAVRQDFLAVYHPQGTREDALPEVCTQVLVAEPRRHGGGKSTSMSMRRLLVHKFIGIRY